MSIEAIEIGTVHRIIEFRADNRPRWRRRSYYLSTGQIFMPAVIFFESEQAAWQKAEDIGGQTMLRDRHIYVDLDWVIKHCPVEELRKTAIQMRERLGMELLKEL